MLAFTMQVLTRVANQQQLFVKKFIILISEYLRYFWIFLIIAVHKFKTKIMVKNINLNLATLEHL